MGVYSDPRTTDTYPQRPAGSVMLDDPAPGSTKALPPPMPPGTRTLPPLPAGAKSTAPGATGAPPGTSGTGSDAAVAQANAAYNQGQRGSDPNVIFGGPGGADAYRQWYSQQQGGNRPEDLARYSNQVIAQWDQYAIKSGPDAGKYRSMRGAEGTFDKPTDCPPGQSPSGPDETDPCKGNTELLAAQGGGGGGGAGVGAGFGGGPAGWGLSAEEKGYLSSLTQLADTMRGQSEKLFATGMPAYQLTVEHWKKMMGAYGRGGVDAALGPAREGISEAYAGAGSQLRGQRGAEKAAGEATLARGEAGDLGRLPAEQQAQAAAGLQGAAQFGITTAQGGQGQAAGVIGTQEQATAQSRLTEEGLASQQGIAQLQAKTSWDIASLNANVSREQIGAEQSLAQSQLAQRAYEFENNYALQNAQLNAQINQWNQQNKLSSQQNTNSLWSGIFSGLGMLGAAWISDAELKTRITPAARGLKELRGLKSFNYVYIDDPDATPQLGVMAQDLEKVAPELVVNTPAGKAINSYGLIAMTIEAVKELDRTKADRVVFGG